MLGAVAAAVMTAIVMRMPRVCATESGRYTTRRPEQLVGLAMRVAAAAQLQSRGTRRHFFVYVT